MIVIGLTGSLATGKSTVSRLLREPPYRLPVIDADVLARQALAPGTSASRRVIAHFAATTPDLLVSNDDGMSAIDRAALGRRVFGSDAQRQRDRRVLNGIVHPLVRRAMLWQVLWYYIRGFRAVVLDIPLLYEGSLDLFCSVVIMVAVSSPEVQMQRLRARDQALSQQEAKDRVESQMGVQEKSARTHARGPTSGKVVLNDGSMQDLHVAVGLTVQDILCGSYWWPLCLLLNPFLAVLAALWSIGRSHRARRRFRELTKKC